MNCVILCGDIAIDVIRVQCAQVIIDGGMLCVFGIVLVKHRVALANAIDLHTNCMIGKEHSRCQPSAEQECAEFATRFCPLAHVFGVRGFPSVRGLW